MTASDQRMLVLVLQMMQLELNVSQRQQDLCTRLAMACPQAGMSRVLQPRALQC